MSGEAPAAASTAAGTSDLVAALLHRAPRLAMAVAAGRTVWPVAKTLRNKSREHRTYTVKVLDTDAIYDDLHEWVLGLLPTERQRALVAWTSKRDSGMVSPDGPPSTPPRLRLRYDGSREQIVTIGGHSIRVIVSDGNGAATDAEKRWKPAEIVFTASSLQAQQALLDAISQVARLSHETRRKPVFKMLTRWGDWSRVDDLPTRDLDSVILAKGQLERLVADVSTFLANEQDYIRRCIPWHRGHLYEGPPGTGKTSVARAIATHFGMDIWYLPLGDVKSDCDLLNVVSRVTPRSVLLLEDVDVFGAATDRAEGEERVTLSGLLNALDGIATPHGLFTVLTTNDVKAIDAAVIRPGRIDLVEHFGLADDDQVARLVSRWYDRPLPFAVESAIADLPSIAPAAVIEACKRHENPADAVAELNLGV